MAKKTAELPDGVSETKINAAWKECPACHKYIRGLKTKECPNCHTLFPVKEKKEPAESSTATTSTSHSTSASTSTEDALFFILRTGGAEAALQTLDDLELNPAMDFAIKTGGIANAKKQIQAIQRRLA